MTDMLGWVATAVFVGSYFFTRPALLRAAQMVGRDVVDRVWRLDRRDTGRGRQRPGVRRGRLDFVSREAAADPGLSVPYDPRHD